MKPLPKPMKRTQPKTMVGRKCAICGRPGGSGLTTALRLAGVHVETDQIGYAHADCLAAYRARKQ